MSVLDAFRLDDQVAIVTGAGRGLGRAMALAFADAGAHVVCAARTVEQIDETAALIEQRGRRALSIPTDASDPAAFNALAATTMETFGRIDVLLNNAGNYATRNTVPLDELIDDEFQIDMDINFTSKMYGARAVVPHMAAAGHGSIINLASIYAFAGRKDWYTYFAAKAAVVNFTRSLALSYTDVNIRANAIAPGPFPVSHFADQANVFNPKLAVPRFGQPWELGPLAVFLASDASAGVNGETIIIDGGGLAGGVVPPTWRPRVALPGGDA
jgi:NAD(P)-dependent dehydrogenase (short-subunit alcohol dehydrogenase family)